MMKTCFNHYYLFRESYGEYLEIYYCFTIYFLKENYTNTFKRLRVNYDIGDNCIAYNSAYLYELLVKQWRKMFLKLYLLSDISH